MGWHICREGRESVVGVRSHRRGRARREVGIAEMALDIPPPRRSALSPNVRYGEACARDVLSRPIHPAVIDCCANRVDYMSFRVRWGSEAQVREREC